MLKKGSRKNRLKGRIYQRVWKEASIMSKRFLLFLVCLIASFAIIISPLLAEDKPEVFVQLGHSSLIESIAISSEGDLIASADSKVIKIWKTDSGRLLREKSINLKETGASIFYRCFFTDDRKKLLCFSSTDEKDLLVVTFDFIADSIKNEKIKLERVLTLVEEYHSKKGSPRAYIIEELEKVRKLGPVILVTGNEMFYYIMSRLGFSLYENVKAIKTFVSYNKRIHNLSFEEKVRKLYYNIINTTNYEIDLENIIFTPEHI